VRISYEENWQTKQWTAICSAYGNAPFFEYYVDDIQPLFEQKTPFLFEHNLKVLNVLFFVLDFKPTIKFSDSYLTEPVDEMVDFRNQISPKESVGSMDKTYQIIPYQQVFAEKNGFLPNLSILDLIFCKGPETLSILENSLVQP